MRAIITVLALALSPLVLASCGFQPMYAPSAGGAAIGPVNVSMIEGRAGHVLKTELDRLLMVDANASGPPHQLTIRLRENVSRLGIRLDESASRAELRLTADYVLTPSEGRAVRGRMQTVVNYEIPTAAFGEIAAQDDARDRAAETLAQRMRAELALRLAQVRANNTQASGS
jgi:LPS-assembly lipoprotein